MLWGVSSEFRRTIVRDQGSLYGGGLRIGTGPPNEHAGLL